VSEFAEGARAALRKEFLLEYDDGMRCGLLGIYGYPKGFHGWPLGRP
jgi:hypothetical protein